ncbi:hypothetical protein B0O80DRAFT_452966 [Mortierella sp. GBAus27b]|nr:hypothetical protein B0O80DRAFT_452966 [Mortierella sp. GBAus27b]
MQGKGRKLLTSSSPDGQHQGRDHQRLQTQPVLKAQELNSTISFSAPKSPLEIEEVLHEIISHLDRNSIYSCVFVSRVFYRASIRVLWTSVYWKSFAQPDTFLSEFDRYGHNAIQLHDTHHADLKRVARICSHLRELRLNWTLASDEELEDIFRGSPKISYLSLFSCAKLSTQGLVNIAMLRQLRRLELRNMVNLDEPSLVTLLRTCTLLEHLALDDVRLSRITMDSLETTPLRITTLSLTRSSPTGSLVQSIVGNSPNIKKLSLARNTRSVLYKGNMLPHMDTYKHLSSLNLESCKRMDGDTILAVIHACLMLERVNLSGTHVDNAALEVLAVQCTKLVSLNVAWCRNITDQGLLRVLESCERLSFLDLSTANVISATIFWQQAPWTRCTQLKTLIMTGVNMALPPRSSQMNHTMMFQQLSRLESLQDLTIGDPSLELQIEAGLGTLEKLCNLESLRIKNLQAALGDDEVRWMIDAWPKLKRARFESGSLSTPWLRHFRQQRPHLVLC